MTKKDGEINSITEAAELFQLYLKDLYIEIADKENSISINKEDLKQIYLDAAEKVGQGERTIREMKFNDSDAKGIKAILEAFRFMRKMYIAYANGQPTKAKRYFTRYLQSVEKYISIRKRHFGVPDDYEIDNNESN